MQGNLIGVDGTGLQPLPNDQGGFWLVSGSGNVIGGPEQGAGNVISGNNLAGVQLDFVTSATLQGNKIGTDITGTVAIPNNGSYGVRLTSPALNFVLDNVIAFNSGVGVHVAASASLTTVTGNSIHSNLQGSIKRDAPPPYSFDVLDVEGSEATLLIRTEDGIEGPVLLQLFDTAAPGGDASLPCEDAGQRLVGELATTVPAGRESRLIVPLSLALDENTTARLTATVTMGMSTSALSKCLKISASDSICQRCLCEGAQLQRVDCSDQGLRAIPAGITKAATHLQYVPLCEHRV